MTKHTTAGIRRMLRASVFSIAGAMLLGNAHAAPPIRIMVIDPMSGPQSPTMESSAKSLQFAVKRDNDAGGILGSKVELEFCDDKFNPKDGRNCLDRAIGVTCIS